MELPHGLTSARPADDPAAARLRSPRMTRLLNAEPDSLVSAPRTVSSPLTVSHRAPAARIAPGPQRLRAEQT